MTAWVAVDAGNTRVKWALMRGGDAPGEVHIGASRALSAACRRREVWLSHVGGDAALARLRGVLRDCRRLVRVRSRAAACGVVNRYRPPSALGSDRWLALLAVGRRRRGVVVVSAGTAVTIDALRADGVYAGGLILPGQTAMLKALAHTTPLSRPADAQAAALAMPADTAAAMRAGAAYAAAGAVREFRRRFLPGAAVWITGGDAARLLPFLPAARHAPYLVLRGLARLRAAGG